MLLVDHDQPEVVERREHGRARAHAHARLAAAHAPPLVVALARRQPRVDHRHRRPRSARRSGPPSAGVSAISGTSTIAERPRSSAAATARRYTSVLPLPVTPWSRSGSPGARPRPSAPRPPPAPRAGPGSGSGARPAAAPTCSSTGRRDGSAVWSSVTRPRRSRARSVPCPQPTWRASAATASGPPDSARRAATCRSPSPAPALLGRDAAGVGERRRAASCAPAAGGRSPCRCRVGARARGRARAPSSTRGRARARGARAERARRPPAPAAARRAAPAAARSPRRGPRPRPSRRRGPKGTTSMLPTRDPGHVAPQPVVEGAAERAGRGQRLDLGDHASNLRGGPDAGRWAAAPARDMVMWARGRGLRGAGAARRRARASASVEARLTLLRGAARGRRARRRAAPRRGPEPARAAAGGARALRGQRALHAGGGGRALRPRARPSSSGSTGRSAARARSRGARVRRERRAPGHQRAADPGGRAARRRDPRDRPRAGPGSGQPRGHGGHRLRLRLPARRRHRVRPVGPLRRGDARAAARCSSRAWARRCACTSAR